VRNYVVAGLFALLKGFCFCVSFFLGLYYISSLEELSLNFLESGRLFRHPGMTEDISYFKPLVRLIFQHVCYQVLERIAEETLRFLPRVLLPKNINPVI
jgi:hypothetical protein